VEAQVVSHESGLDEASCLRLVRVGERIRKLKNRGLDEGVSTRLLIYAARLIAAGLDPSAACAASIVEPLSDDPELRRSMTEIIRDFF
jgi:nitric oxide reductase NorQ protein